MMDRNAKVIRNGEKMRGNNGSRSAKRTSAVILFLVMMALVLGASLKAREKSLVDTTIEDFEKDRFLLKHGEEKTLSIKNSVEISVRPVDMVLLLDVSSSMNNYPDPQINKGRYRIDLEKRIAAKFVSDVPSYTRIAIIPFGEEDLPSIDFTNDKSHLQDIIDKLEASGSRSRAGDKLNEALSMATQNENPCIIVLITDGIETGSGLYIFDDFIGRGSTEGIPISCALINPNLDYGEFEEKIIETGGILTIIEEESNVPIFSEKVGKIIDNYALEDFTMQVKPSPDVKSTLIEVVQGNSLFPKISETTMKVAAFSPHTKLRLDIESAVDVRKYLEPQQITPYSIDITFVNPFSQENVYLSDMKSPQVYFEFESFFEHYQLSIMSSMLGIVAVMGIVVTRGYNRHLRRTEARSLVILAENDVRNHEFRVAIENLEKATRIYRRLGDQIVEKYDSQMEDLRKKLNEMEKKKSRIMKISAETQGNLKNAMQVLRTERYIEGFFPSFTRLHNVLGVQNVTDSTLTRAVESIKLNKDPEVLDRYYHNFEKFSSEFSPQFLGFRRALNLYENENSKELMKLLLQQHQRLGVDNIAEVFFEEDEVARLLLDLWKLNHPEEKGEFNVYISSEEKEGYELLARLRDMHENISQRMNILRKETSHTTIELLNNIIADIDKAHEVCQGVLQDFSSKFEETLDPEYESVINTCKDIQKDLILKRDNAEILKNNTEKDIEIKTQSLLDEFKELRRRIELGDYQEDIVNAVYRLHSMFQSVGAVSASNECYQVATDLDKKLSIVGLLDNTRVISIPGLCENIGISLDERGKQKAEDLCRQIIAEKNKRSNQYQLFTECNPEIFLDFNLLAQYTLEKGKVPSEVITDIETLFLPKAVHVDLINVLKRSRGDMHD
jgi:hypothetical protein